MSRRFFNLTTRIAHVYLHTRMHMCIYANVYGYTLYIQSFNQQIIYLQTYETNITKNDNITMKF